MFLDKLKPYLHIGSKNKLKKEYLSPHNEYYGRVADRFGTVQMLLLAVLAVFLLISLIFNNEWVSYENLHYFITDFGGYLTSADSGIDKVILDAGEESGFGVFGGKLAVAGKTGLRLYTASGRLAVSGDDIYSRSAVETSDRYMLVYGTGGKELSIYNLFTKVHSETTKYPIYGAAVADNGSYALITGDNTHTSAVKVYDRRFEEIFSRGLASYAVDAALSGSGDRLAILSFAEKDGSVVTKLCLSKVPANDPYAEHEIAGTMPLYCAFTSSGNAIAVCTDRILTYDRFGRLKEEIITRNDASRSEPVDIAVGDFGCSAVYDGYDGCELFVIDKNGHLVYNQTVSDRIISTAGYGNSVFFETDKEIIRFGIGNAKEDRVPKNASGRGVLLARNAEEVFYCMPSEVRYIKF